MKMTNGHKIPPELAQLTSPFEAQPALMQLLVQYCLALVLVETGKAKFISTIPSDNGPICMFETARGERLSLTRPPVSDQQEQEVKQWLRRILEEDV
jgi:hypothetical protein